PAIVIIADPGPRILSGVVRDTAQFKLAGVEVSIPSLQRRTITGADGSFRFDGIAKGDYDVRARVIGYAPQIRRIHVDTLGGNSAFELIPIARMLPAVVSN